MANVKDKISKLLALAESPNENEAKLALLKARALMAEYKLTERDLTYTNLQVIDREVGVSCTKMTNAWAAALANVIASHYCCKCLRRRVPGSKTSRIVFVGLQDDFEIAKGIFLYAYDCVISQCESIKRAKKRLGWSSTDIRKACNAYGNGFVAGLNQMYQEQSQDHSDWGLVMVEPKPVVDYFSTLKTRKTNFSSRDETWTRSFRADGFENGKSFRPDKRLN